MRGAVRSWAQVLPEARPPPAARRRLRLPSSPRIPSSVFSLDERILGSPPALLHPPCQPAEIPDVATDSIKPGGASRPGAEPCAPPRHTPALARQHSVTPQHCHTAAPKASAVSLGPQLLASSVSSTSQHGEAPEQLPAPLTASPRLGHGQRATSLPPSSVSARAHEQRWDRKTPQKARKDRDEPSPGSAGPGDKPFGDSVGRDVPAAAATAPRLRPPSRCRGGGRSLQGRRCASAEGQCRKQEALWLAPGSEIRGGKLAGGRFPLAAWGRGAESAGGTPVPRCLRRACAPDPGWGIPGAARAQGSAHCHPKFIPAACFLHKPGPAGSWRG